MWGQFFDAPLGYLELFTWQSTTGSREVPELEVRECPPSMLRNVDDGPLGGVGAGLRFEGTQCLRSPPLVQGGEWLQKPRDKCSKSS
jgi:hypothetical protein